MERTEIGAQKPMLCGKHYDPTRSGEERMAALRSIEGMWKDRTPCPIDELQQMRAEGERATPLPL